MFVAFSDIAIFHFNIAIISDDFFLSDLELGGVRIKDFDSNSLCYLELFFWKTQNFKLKKYGLIFSNINLMLHFSLIFLFFVDF